MGKPRVVPMSDPRTICVVHHTAADDRHTTIDDLKAERARRNEGYNGIIDDDMVFVDLADGHDGKASFSVDAPENEISNGDYGYNQLSFNISIDGNFETATPTEDEINTLVQVLATKCKAWGWKKSDVLGTSMHRSRIATHQEVGRYWSQLEKYETQCPGKNLIALMPSIRSRVAHYLPS